MLKDFETLQTKDGKLILWCGSRPIGVLTPTEMGWYSFRSHLDIIQHDTRSRSIPQIIDRVKTDLNTFISHIWK